MKLSKVYLDAYKSLLNKELVINHDCIGLVGTNESGKSNLLSALNMLNGNDYALDATDYPRMAKNIADPCIRFHFALDESEQKQYIELIENHLKGKTHLGLLWDDKSILYTIKYNKITNDEERFFSINALGIKEGYIFLKTDKHSDPSKIWIEDKFIALSEALLIQNANLEKHKKHEEEIGKKLEAINIRIANFEAMISLESRRVQEISTSDQSSLTKAALVALQKQMTAATKELKKQEEALLLLKQEKKDLELNNSQSFIEETKISLEKCNYELNKINDQISALEAKIDEVDKDDLDEDEEVELKKHQELLAILELKIPDIESQKENIEDLLEDLNIPLEEKYTNDLLELQDYLKDALQKHFIEKLPKVVFWEHSSNYILESETLFSKLLPKSSLEEISRPLVNIFRIGLGVRTIDELKSQISEIQDNPNERSRIQKTLNRKINEYIKRVWQDYDQEINITLEKDQIRIEFFDPLSEKASYYNMEERSQGCQTFLSFLLTIGAEAEHGVISNTILLLDEPETHLHPSGVRFMLQELIKISEKNNIVIYATHSIFLIDRNNFNRHIILEKKKEQTYIKPANIGRIGYFMQEEVLYNTLDLDLNTDFSSSKTFNFVFEGDGDAVLFEHYYNNIMSKDEKPFPSKNTGFYQGGKCTDIKKYFMHKPISLGTKWIFILDKDKPASELKKTIEARYKDYIGSDIYVFQYGIDKKVKDELLELEDILPLELICEAYIETAKSLELTISLDEIKKIVNEKEGYIKYNEIFVTKYIRASIKDDFKAAFKQTLNDIIKRYIKSNNNELDFKRVFNLYNKWAMSVISKIGAKSN